ncbi:MAG: tRNA (adenosine(37)-N6)-threonylcarbamoyltransferase complex transferase subunit TsaD [Opitutaceae bacterium]
MKRVPGLILGIETSCDETAAAVFDPERGVTRDCVHSQIALHGRHGGVVPDLAAREHLSHLPPLIEQAVAGAVPGSIARIAVTRGPGLAPCLALGVASAKALGLALRLPIEGVNHLRGHVWSPFLPLHAEEHGRFDERMAGLLPHLGLVVSGGHTLLVAADAAGSAAREGGPLGGDAGPPGIPRLVLRVLSATRDDAAGEALDKGAKLLGLGYPGGPLVEREAAGGDPAAFDFPRALGRAGELDFSFSGLKTSLRYAVEKLGPSEAEARRPDLCASYQAAVVDSLAKKTRTALERGSFRSLGLSGGVARNLSLRRRLAAEARRAGAAFLPVQPEQAGDNAAVIAFAAWIDPEGAVRGGPDLAIAPSLGL